MKRLALSLSALFVSAAAVAAADDPVAVRKALMQSNAGAASVSSEMLRGNMDYNPAVAKAAIAAFHATAMSVGDFYPEGSNTGDTTAAPAIWENPEAFQAAHEEFRADTAAAVEASGKDGPADLAAFQAAVGPVLENCRSCHEDFRIEDD